jgi:hypothetical protein
MLGVAGVLGSQVSGDDSVRANLDGVPCSGHGDTLYVVANSGNRLSPVSVDCCRLRWREGSYPYTAFMRNCNLTNTPRSCRGMLCIFRSHATDKPRLGVVGNLSPLWCRKLSIFEWTGATIMDSGVFTPEFMYFADGFPVNFATVRSQFTLIELEFDSVFPPDVVFVNTVSSHPAVPRQHNCTNQVDGCFEMSPKGPDVMMAYESMPQFGNFSVPLWRGEVQFNSNNPDVGYNRHLTKGAPTCFSEPKRTIHHLPSIFHTIESDGCPVVVEEDELLFRGKIAVPYVKQHVINDGDVVTFGYVSKSDWRDMVSKKSMTIENHNKLLSHKAVGETTLRVGKLDPQKKGGIRVSVANREELKPFVKDHRWVRDKQLEDMYTCQSLSEPNESGPGNVVVRFTIQRQVSFVLL